MDTKQPKNWEVQVMRLTDKACEVMDAAMKKGGELYNDLSEQAVIGYKAVMGKVEQGLAFIKGPVTLFIKIIIAGLLLSIIAMVLSFILGVPELGTFSGGIALTLLLIINKGPEIILKFMDGTLGNIPLTEEVTRGLTKGIRGMLKPFLYLAFIMGFVSLFGTLYNMEFYSFKVLTVSYTATLFFLSYAFIKDQIWFAWKGIMVTIIVVGLFFQGFYLVFPEPVKSRVYDLQEIGGYLISGKEKEVRIVKGSHLFDETYKKKSTLKNDTTAKVLSEIKEESTGERYSRIILSDGTGQYIKGSKEYLVLSSRLREKAVEKKPEIQPTSYVPQTQVPPSQNQAVDPPVISSSPTKTIPPAPKKRQVVEQWIDFPASGQVTVPLYGEVGDKVEYVQMTAPFETNGVSSWHLISRYQDFAYTSSEDSWYIRGAGSAGKVLIRITPGYYNK